MRRRDNEAGSRLAVRLPEAGSCGWPAPDLGPWEQVFYAELDGRRRKRVVLKASGD